MPYLRCIKINQPIMKNLNSIASGDSSTKFHIWNGAKTLCNRKSLFAETKKYFIEMSIKYPQQCCKKCLSKLK